MVRAFEEAVKDAQNAVNVKELQEALSENDRGLLAMIVEEATKTFETIAGALYPPRILDTLQDAGTSAGATAKAAGTYRTAQVEVVLAFDRTNPKAVKWARERSAGLVDGITAETRKGIQELVATGFEKGRTTASTARAIRGSIGLTERGSAALVNAKDRLTKAKPGTLVKLGKKKYRIPAGGLSTAQVDNFVGKYGAKLLHDRAKVIARTETIAAANEGQRQLWDQAAKEGLLTGGELREWIVTPDDRLCEECEPMEGELAGINDNFTHPETGEQLIGPPLHQDCRCATGLTTKQVQTDEEMFAHSRAIHEQERKRKKVGTPTKTKLSVLPKSKNTLFTNIAIDKGIRTKVRNQFMKSVDDLHPNFVSAASIDGPISLKVQLAPIAGRGQAVGNFRRVVGAKGGNAITLRRVPRGKGLEQILRHEMGHAMDSGSRYSNRIRAAWLEDLKKFGTRADDVFLTHYKLNAREAFAQSVSHLTGKTVDAAAFRAAFKNTLGATKDILDELKIPTVGAKKFKSIPTVPKPTKSKLADVKNVTTGKEFTASEAAVIDDYTAGQFLNTQFRLRDGLELHPQIQAQVKELDNAIKGSVLKKETKLYRAIPRNVAEKLQPGKVYKDRGFVSWTQDKSLIPKIVDDAIGESSIPLVVRMPKGTAAVETNLVTKPGGKYRYQLEVLIGRNHTFKVITRSEKSIIVELVK